MNNKKLILSAFALLVVIGIIVIATKYSHNKLNNVNTQTFSKTDSFQLHDFILKKDFASAETLAIDYEQKYPTNIEVKLTKGIAEFQLHKIKEATASFRSVLKIDPTNKVAQAYIAIIFSPQSGVLTSIPATPSKTKTIKKK
jgi:tetratricopeptide (TPR) repeat protein